MNTCAEKENQHGRLVDLKRTASHFISLSLHAFFLILSFISDLEIDISEKLLQGRLHNLVTRIGICSRHGLVFNQDVSDLMNRLTGGDPLVPAELQVIEANLDIATDYDGNLLQVLTTPVGPEKIDKVKKYFFLNLFQIFRAGFFCVNVPGISENCTLG